MEGMAVTVLGIESANVKHALLAFKNCQHQRRHKAI